MKHFLITVLVSALAVACNDVPRSKEIQPSPSHADAPATKIRAALKSETKAACDRDYEAWKSHWIQRKNVTKTYMDFENGSFSEMTSWDEIDDFVRIYIEEHPDPVDAPELPSDIKVKVYGEGAWVSYEVDDPTSGRKRESRLMEKEDGKWKIAGMHTTIYGKDDQDGTRTIESK